jgi:short-subunit dehydrogenase
MPGPLQAIYYASKSYVSSLTNAISEELKGTGVSITNIMPGPTKSNFGARSGMDKTIIFKKTASSKEVAAKTYESMLRGRRNSYAGVGLFEKIVLYTIPLLPKSLVLRVTKKLQVKLKD